MSEPIFYAAICCLAAVVLEGVCAGGDIRSRLAELRKPRFVPPLWGWIAIGVVYYVICFAVLYRLFSLTNATPFRSGAILLTVLLMLINAGWNWSFFRSRNLLYALLLGVCYTVLALMLTALLLRIDRVAAACLAPYLVYLVYANVWGYAIWKLNRS